jgi:two-component system, chemotaxis family, chemotaxis protein CheY
MAMTARTVLLVEDDYDVRETIAEVLADEGYDVVTAVDGQDALDKLRAGARPFAILLDLMMAGMNGFQFRAEQRADPALAAIPVIVLTADRQVDDKARELGADAYVRKPTQLENLLAVLARFH